MKILICSSVILLAAISVKAHDPLQSNVDGLVRADGMELTVTMARSAGAAVLGPQGVDAGPEAIKAAASQLCVLSTGDGALKLRDAEAKLTVENDVEFRLNYARPAAGKLEIGLPYLKKMPEGHCATLIVSGEANEALGVRDVWPEDAPFAVTIPPAAR